MDLMSRREILETAENPDQGLDYVITLEGSMGISSGPEISRVQVRYVPDKSTLSAQSFQKYLKILDKFESEGPEATAIAVLDDLNNEVVPRWVQINLTIGSHQVLLEDRQPAWDNQALLSRLKLI